LILDEPLSGLDPIGRRDVVDILTEYKRGGGTLFLTSHVLHDVERLADRFGLIHQGVLRAVRSPAELTGDQEMVLVRTFGETPVAGMREDFSGRWIGEVPRADLWERLEALRNAGHVVLEVCVPACPWRWLSCVRSDSRMKGSRKKFARQSASDVSPLDPASLALMRLVEAAQVSGSGSGGTPHPRRPPESSAGLEGAGLCPDRAGAFRRSPADRPFFSRAQSDDPEAHNNLGIVLSR
jgi:hypothetical protein